MATGHGKRWDGVEITGQSFAFNHQMEYRDHQYREEEGKSGAREAGRVRAAGPRDQPTTNVPHPSSSPQLGIFLVWDKHRPVDVDP